MTKVGTLSTSTEISASATATVGGNEYLYVAAGDSSGNVEAYSINADTGAPTSLGSSATGGSSATRVVVNPSATFAYVIINSGNNPAIAAFAINQTTGALGSSPIQTLSLPRATGVYQGFAVCPSGTYLAINNHADTTGSAYNGETSLYAIGSDGKLTYKKSIDTGSSPMQVAFVAY